MQFDLFTFLASLFNFLVLMALLRVFLFKRVTNAMDEREQRISDTWDEAEDARGEAEQAREEYEQQLEEAEEERESLFETAREEADRERSKRLEQARQEVDEQRASWFEDLEREKEELTHRITETASQATAEAVEQMLRTLADSSLTAEVVSTLSRKIRTDWAGELGELSGELEVTVRTAHELGKDAAGHIRSALDEVLTVKTVSFETDPALICGVRLELGDKELGFSVADQLQRIRQGVESALKAGAEA